MAFPAISCLGTDGQWRLHVFKGSHFWEVTADGNVSEPRALQKRWPGLPPNIEAAAVSLEDGDFYFFKGISPESAEIAMRRRGWGGPTRSDEREGSPAMMSSWWNSLLNLWPRKDSFQGWSWEQQVSRWSSEHRNSRGRTALQSAGQQKVWRCLPCHPGCVRLACRLALGTRISWIGKAMLRCEEAG